MSATFVVESSSAAIPGCFTVGTPQGAGTIAVPRNVADVASHFGVADPEDFAAFSVSFPDQIAQALNWSEAEVIHAGRLLAQTLGLPDERFSPAFGATLPKPLQGLTPAQFAQEKHSLG